MDACGWALLWQERGQKPQNKLCLQLESIVAEDIPWLVISKGLVVLKKLERFPRGIGDHVHHRQHQQHPKKGRGFLGRRTEVQYPLRGFFFFFDLLFFHIIAVFLVSRIKLLHVASLIAARGALCTQRLHTELHLVAKPPPHNTCCSVRFLSPGRESLYSEHR